jgi:hypothetical protein
VNDIIFDNEKTSENQICTYLNFFHKQLEFKPTKEENGLINCLDLTINRHTNHINIEINRKPTSTDTTLHIKPPNGTQNSGLQILNKKDQHPALTDTNKEQELNNITIEAKNNGFSNTSNAKTTR